MGKRLECLAKAGKNAPRALVELAVLSSIPSGLVAGIGSGLSYLASNHKLASDLGTFGIVSGGLGIVILPLYLEAINTPHTEPGIYEPDSAIQNFLDAVKEYKNISKKNLR